jgi:hypothetical protein
MNQINILRSNKFAEFKPNLNCKIEGKITLGNIVDFITGKNSL